MQGVFLLLIAHFLTFTVLKLGSQLRKRVLSVLLRELHHAPVHFLRIIPLQGTVPSLGRAISKGITVVVVVVPPLLSCLSL